VLGDVIWTALFGKADGANICMGKLMLTGSPGRAGIGGAAPVALKECSPSPASRLAFFLPLLGPFLLPLAPEEFLFLRLGFLVPSRSSFSWRIRRCVLNKYIVARNRCNKKMQRRVVMGKTEKIN